MPDRPPQDFDDTQNLSGTQPVNLPEWNTPPSTARVPSEPRAARKQKPPKQKSNDRSRSALYLPAWSVGLMLLLVFGITAAIVMLVYTLGGSTPPGGEPRVIIITANPSATPDAVESPVPAFLPDGTAQTFDGPVPTFALEGPTLPPIILSPTPLSITLGATVIVNSENLRIRPDPSLDNTENFFASEGDRFIVVGGPQQGSGLTWWQVEDPDDPSRSGWAAADYLDIAIQ